jgi:hypothetical protein
MSLLCSTIREALLLPGSFLITSFLSLQYFLGLRLTSSVAAAALSVPVTLFTGGVGAWVLYEAGWNWSNFMLCVPLSLSLPIAPSFPAVRGLASLSSPSGVGLCVR